MGGVTKLRGRQTNASKIYDPLGTGLASDGEVEARVKLHSALYHHNRNDVTKLLFDDDQNLTDIKTFNNENEDILLAHSAFTFDNGNISEIDKKIYSEDGNTLYIQLKKTFNFDTNGNLTSIDNKLVE